MPVRNGLTEIDQALLFTIDKSESTFGQVGDYATVYVYNYQELYDFQCERQFLKFLSPFNFFNSSLNVLYFDKWIITIF